MSVLTFLSQDDLDDLPDDPALAFARFSFQAQRRLAELSSQLDADNQNEWRELEDLRHSFMNVVVAAAKSFEIEPFVSMEVPSLSGFRNEDHRQFSADLDHYLTQLMLHNSIQGKRDSVEIFPKSKDQIRQYVYNLRTCIEEANMTAPKREALLKKLAIIYLTNATARDRNFLIEGSPNVDFIPAPFS